MKRIIKIGIVLIFMIIGIILIPKEEQAVIYKNSSSTTKITINGTDANYNGNTLTASNVTVKVGGAGVTATVQRSEPIAITNGVQYVLTITNIPTTANGDLSLNIAENTLSDKAGNQNIVTPINNTGITIDNIAPTTTAPTATSTTKSVTITNKQTDSVSGINSSSIQYGIEKNGTWVWQTSNTFLDLTNDTTYPIKTKVTDNAGNTSESSQGIITTIRAVARINSTDYTTLASAITAAGTSGEIEIMMINHTTENVTVPSDKNIKLLLNGKTITGKTTNEGALTISGTGTMKNTNVGAIQNNGTLYINDGTIESTRNSSDSEGFTLVNNKKLVINGGTLKSGNQRGMFTIFSTDQVEMNGGNVIHEGADSGTAMYINSGTFSMTGGAIQSDSFGLVVNGGTANSTGGTVTAYSAVLVRNVGKGEFKNTTIKSTGDYAVYNYTGTTNKVIIRNRNSNYGITGNVNGIVVATTNTEAGQSSEKVTIYNTGSSYAKVARWLSGGSVQWSNSTNSSGTHTITISKANFGNASGNYYVDVYKANSSWTVGDYAGGVRLEM